MFKPKNLASLPDATTKIAKTVNPFIVISKLEYFSNSEADETVID